MIRKHIAMRVCYVMEEVKQRRHLENTIRGFATFLNCKDNSWTAGEVSRIPSQLSSAASPNAHKHINSDIDALFSICC